MLDHGGEIWELGDRRPAPAGEGVGEDAMQTKRERERSRRMVLLDPAENLHPYECDGRGRCVHCDRRVEVGHDPETCALCNYDGWSASLHLGHGDEAA